MKTKRLDGWRIAILATDGVEHSELQKPREALIDAGAEVQVVAPKHGSITSWKHDHWGRAFAVDASVDEVRASDFDALVIPGGVMNCDKLRTDDRAVDFVRDFASAGKPIAAICHGPQLLIEAGVLQGVHLTSWNSLKTDLVNAGADWVDEKVVVDRGFITSRMPDDMPAFNHTMIEEFAGSRLPRSRHRIEESSRSRIH